MVPVTFRNGYVWTRAPHVPETTRDMVAQLQNLAEHERDQRVLLSQSSLSEHGWLGFASTSRMPSDRRPEPVTVAQMPEPAVHLRSRSTAAQAEVAQNVDARNGVLSGPGCSGRPGRVGCLGYPVDRAAPAAGEVYDQCQIMGGLPRLDLEIGAGLFLADNYRVLRVVATQAQFHKLPSRQNVFPAVPGTATIRTEKDGR
ncbi:hypothetical protein TIFTF001_055220 [Ficus carica]|uniref:Uncharacterized protein n=1 Tax=Ficus carica TaxID=3494 RepID=A0AA88ED09_FICCA|nr:hypothetical protein TIFTF001_055220 [Ficus carica]